MKVSDLLLEGEGNAISMADLARIAQVPERALRREILQARANGELICSSDKGYFLPADNSEIAAFVAERKAAIRSTNLSLKPFIKALRR